MKTLLLLAFFAVFGLYALGEMGLMERKSGSFETVALPQVPAQSASFTERVTGQTAPSEKELRDPNAYRMKKTHPVS